MPAIINSDDGVLSGSSGLKTSGANDGLLNIQTNGSTAMSINASQQVTFNNGANLPNTFGFKNRIINGGMVIDQRNNGAALTVNSTNAFFAVDRFYGQGQSADGVYTLQQISDAPSGFMRSLRATVTTADASLGATQYYNISQSIEGLNCSDFGWGSAGAQTVTLSFWVKSSVTGTYSGAINNSANNRSYPFTYTISAASTWEQKSVTIPGDITGTWLTDNGVGIKIFWSFGTGSTYSGTAGSWSGSLFIAATGSVNLMATNAATWQITGVQLERGSTATSFDFRPYGTELALCQRYYEKSYDQSVAPGSASTSGYSAGNNPDQGSSVYIFVTDRFAVTKRTTATMRVWDLAGNQGRTTQYTLGGLGRTDNANNIYTYTGAQSAAVMIFVVTASTASTYQWDASAEI